MASAGTRVVVCSILLVPAGLALGAAQASAQPGPTVVTAQAAERSGTTVTQRRTIVVPPDSTSLRARVRLNGTPSAVVVVRPTTGGPPLARRRIAEGSGGKLHVALRDPAPRRVTLDLRSATRRPSVRSVRFIQRTINSGASAPRPADNPGSRPDSQQSGPLRQHVGDVVIVRDGTVLDGWDIHGFVEVRARNVSIRNSIIRGGAPPQEGSTALLRVVDPRATDFRLSDTTLRPARPSVRVDGIMVSRPSRFEGLDLSGTVDGIKIFGDHISVRNSHIHDVIHYPSDPAHGGGPSHDDLIQVQQGRDIQIIGNTLSGAYNAAIQITQDLGPTTDLTIAGNRIDGGGCSINFKSNGAFQSGLRVDNNIFGVGQRVPGCAIIHAFNHSDLRPTGNRWITGAPAGVTRGA